MSFWHGVILAIIEGLTEYLPISSTGHLIITSSFLGINEQAFTKDYTVIVQFGAILSVLVLYWRRFLSSFSFYQKLVIGFLPAAVIGLAIKNHIDALLGNVLVVACALIAGGIVLVFADRWFDRPGKNHLELQDLTLRKSFTIGLIQCLAFIPGMSRSAATILGGLSQKLTRKSAAEFSFLLAVPTLSGATLLKLLKIYKTIEPSQIEILLIGNVVSFVVGIITIRAFIGYLSRAGFRLFGYYRIVVGVLILILYAMGHDLALL